MDIRTRMSVSRRRSNLVVLMTTGLLMGSLFALDRDPAERLEFVRRMAMSMTIIHAVFHGMSLVALRSMVLRGVENADSVLAFYQHPRRISHLDLSAAWVGLFAVAPYLL